MVYTPELRLLIRLHTIEMNKWEFIRFDLLEYVAIKPLPSSHDHTVDLAETPVWNKKPLFHMDLIFIWLFDDSVLSSSFEFNYDSFVNFCFINNFGRKWCLQTLLWVLSMFVACNRILIIDSVFAWRTRLKWIFQKM